MREATRNLAVDVAVLAAYAVAANPALTGIGVHEWLGLGALLLLVVHAALHAGWVAETVRSVREGPSVLRVGNLAVDVLAFVALATCAVSGLMVSGDVLRAFGWYAEGYFFWDPLHAVSAKALLALLVVHVALHWRWIAGFFSRGFRHHEGEDDENEGGGKGTAVEEAAGAGEAAPAAEGAAGAEAEVGTAAEAGIAGERAASAASFPADAQR